MEHLKSYFLLKSSAWWSSMGMLILGVWTREPEIILVGLGGIGIRGKLERISS